MSLTIGVLAMQGAFREHCGKLKACGAHAVEIRRAEDDSDTTFKGLGKFDGIVIPGGESTVIGKLLSQNGLLEAVRNCGLSGMPVYGTCAGLILLCSEIEGADGEILEQPRLGLLDACARRNAFGRQIASFTGRIPVKGVGDDIDAVFIRAPLISRYGPDVDVLSEIELDSVKFPAAVKQGNILASAFHPELTNDLRFHRFFIEMCEEYASRRRNDIP